MINASTVHALSINQMANELLTTMGDFSSMVQGDMGSGKSSLLYMLADKLPTHTPIYFDSTTKDVGDMMIPNFKMLEHGDVVSFATNEELGFHIRKPIILMIDEFGKATPGVKNALLRVLYERKCAGKTLHPDSIVFGTTNLGAEGLSDLIPPHARNRITIYTMRKPNVDETIHYGINHNWDPSVLQWIKENPQVCQSFTEVDNPADNVYIFHPKAQREAFCTGRSMERASTICKKRDLRGEAGTASALAGTIGARAAADLQAFVELADRMPRLQDIKDNPETALLPQGGAATYMVVFRTLTSIDRDWIGAWMKYLPRLSAEGQSLFCNGVRAEGYGKAALVLNTKTWQQWAYSNSHLFAADIV